MPDKHMSDIINNPDHYTTGGYECWDFIEDLDLNFLEANAVKYLTRAGKKTEDPTIDIDKAKAYLRKLGNKASNVQRYFDAQKLDPKYQRAILFILARLPTAALRELES